MKIKPYNPGDRDPQVDGPAWWVTERDRDVSHIVTLAEVLGTADLSPDHEHQRRVAVGNLRARLYEVLREGLSPEALSDHLLWDRDGMEARRLDADPANRPSEQEHRDWRAFELNHRLAAFAFQRLGDRPSHEWSPGLSPMGLAVNCALNLADSRKPRDRSTQDRWWQVVITDLQKILSVIVHREL